MKSAFGVCPKSSARIRCAVPYTQMPNDWMARLKANRHPGFRSSFLFLARGIAAEIARETFGWHRTSAAFSVTAFARTNHVGRPRVAQALRFVAEVLGLAIVESPGRKLEVNLPTGLTQSMASLPTVQPGSVRSGLCTGEADACSSVVEQKKRYMSLAPEEPDSRVRAYTREAEEPETQPVILNLSEELPEAPAAPAVQQPKAGSYDQQMWRETEQDSFYAEANLDLPLTTGLPGVMETRRQIRDAATGFLSRWISSCRPLGYVFQKKHTDKVESHIRCALEQVAKHAVGRYGHPADVVDKFFERLSRSTFMAGQRRSRTTGHKFYPHLFWFVHGKGNELGTNILRLLKGDFDDFDLLKHTKTGWWIHV